MNNQNGNSLLSGMLIFLMVSFIGLKVLNFKLKKIKDTRYRRTQYLCMKDYNGSTRKYVKYMETMNSAIFLAKTIEYLSYIAPQLRPFIIFARKAGKGMTYAQQAYHFSYLKNYLTWNRKGCYFDPRFFKNPYKMKAYGILKRNKVTKKAVMRNKKWNQVIYAKDQNFILKSDLEYKGGRKTDIETQEYGIPKIPKFRKLKFKDLKEAMRQVLF